MLPNILRISLVIEAARLKNAQVVANKFKKLVPAQQRDLWQDGPMLRDMARFRAEFTLPLAANTWDGHVRQVIEIGQKFADSWQLTGMIDEVLDLVATSPNPPGIIWAQLLLDRAD